MKKIEPLKRHPSAERFHQLLVEIGKLHDKKQEDYGRDNDPFANVRKAELWGVPGWVYAMMRVDEKVTRLQSMRRKGRLANESATDSFRDLAVYALIAEVLFEEAIEIKSYDSFANFSDLARDMKLSPKLKKIFKSSRRKR